MTNLQHITSAPSNSITEVTLPNILIRSGQDFCHASPRNINYLPAKDFDRTSNHEENKTKDGKVSVSLATI